MAITKPGEIASAATTVVRTGLTTTDSTTINDVNFDPGNAVDCAGAKRVLLIPRFTGGTAPTVTIEPLIRCGSKWAKLAKTSASADGVAAIVETCGRKMFFRIDAVTGAPSSFDIECALYEPFKFDGPRRG